MRKLLLSLVLAAVATLGSCKKDNCKECDELTYYYDSSMNIGRDTTYSNEYKTICEDWVQSGALISQTHDSANVYKKVKYHCR